MESILYEIVWIREQAVSVQCKIRLQLEGRIHAENLVVVKGSETCRSETENCENHLTIPGNVSYVN